MFNPGDLVVVTNKGDSPLTISYNNRAYAILPDKEAHIPWEAAALWFGDPRSAENAQSVVYGDAETRAVVPDRDSEVRRLCARYGQTDGDNIDFLSTSDRVPRASLATLDGDEIKTVIDDPRGESTTPAVTTISERSTQEEIIRRQQVQIDFLTRTLGERGFFEEGESGSGEPSDDHTTPPEDTQQPPARSNTGPALPEDSRPEDKLKF